MFRKAVRIDQGGCAVVLMGKIEQTSVTVRVIGVVAGRHTYKNHVMAGDLSCTIHKGGQGQHTGNSFNIEVSNIVLIYFLWAPF